MTTNQLQFQANEIKKGDLEETKRANKAQEAQKIDELAHKKAELRETKRKLTEEERHNRNQERIDKAKSAASTISSMTGSLFKGLGTALMNDPEWYNKDPQLVKDVASFSFASPLGFKPDIPSEKALASVDSSDVTADFTLSQSNDKKTVPGIMTLNYLHAIPDYKTMKSIADKYYSFVRHANSGSRNYESNDLMLYLIAISECYGQLTHAARIYSIIRTYKNQNYYYARGYLKSLGCSDAFIQDLLMNISNYRATLNSLIRKLNSFNIPNTFPLFKRKVWLNSRIFKDHEVKRSSNYMFAPKYLYTYQESDHAVLKPSVLNYGLGTSTAAAYLYQLESMIVAIYSSEDIGIMSGDILKAYGDDNLVRMEEVPEDFHIEEGYEPEVLTQINAATVAGDPDINYSDIFTRTINNVSYVFLGKDDANPIFNDTLDVRTARRSVTFNESLISSPTVEITDVQVTNNIINLYHDNPSPDDVMVASRLQCCYTPEFEKEITTDPLLGNDITLKSSRRIVSTATEIITTVRVVFQGTEGGILPGTIPASDPTSRDFHVVELYDGVVSVNVRFDQFFGYTMSLGSDIIRLTEVLSSVITKFDWAPRLRILANFYRYGTNLNSQPEYRIIYDNIDLANYMILDQSRLEKLHLVACMSMYDL